MRKLFKQNFIATWFFGLKIHFNSKNKKTKERQNFKSILNKYIQDYYPGLNHFSTMIGGNVTCLKSDFNVNSLYQRVY